MNYYSDSINNLIEEMASLPGIGPKSAQRLAFHILKFIGPACALYIFLKALQRQFPTARHISAPLSLRCRAALCRPSEYTAPPAEIQYYR